jgi:glycosyltransferase involved in cell wall biosynthesis
LNERRKSVCLIAGGLTENTIMLQPWRYLHEVARQLVGQGHYVAVISDSGPAGPRQGLVDGLPVQRIPSVSAPRWGANRRLEQAIRRSNPDVILWHVGLTSFLHQQFDRRGKARALGIFTSPIYRPQELTRLGMRKLARGYRLSAAHILGTLAPKWFLRRSIGGRLERLVVQTRATHGRLLEYGLPAGQLAVIPPGVDERWRALKADDGGKTRRLLGYTEQDTIAVYFGSPAQLRGLHTLIRAIAIGRRSDPSLKLLVLSRQRADELAQESAELRQLLGSSDVGPHVNVVSGYLPLESLVRHVAASDLVALPFEIVPSDAPLSLLEAQALGKPVVTTDVGCLAELVSQGAAYLARPADSDSLAQALRQAAHDLHARAGAAPAMQGAFEPRREARTWQQMGEEWSHLIQSL